MKQARRHRPELSVIMANHNGAAFLQSAVESVLAQSFSDFELLVSDDCSTDTSRTILAAIKDPRLHIVEGKENAGPSIARNRALEAARGKWIAIVDADDLLHVNRLQVLLDVADANNAPLVADNQLFFEDNGQMTGESLFHLQTEVVEIGADALLHSDFAHQKNLLGYLKPLIRRDVLADLRYRPEMRIGEDFDLLLRLTLAGHTLTLVSDALYYYRRRSGSTSHRLKPTDVAAMILALEDLKMHGARHNDAIDLRIADLHRRMAFETVVENTKTKRWGLAAAGMVRDPLTVYKLGKLAVHKVRNRKSKGPKAGAPPGFQVGIAKVPRPKVHVRMPTYNRPEQLRRAIKSLQDQTVSHWVCDVFDDDPMRTSQSVVADFGDARVKYHANVRNLRASKNIDQCFSKLNPHGAEYFCVLEDDNQFLPTHFEDNIQVMEREGVQVVLRNQLVEYASGTDEARLSKTGLLEAKFVEGVYSSECFRLALMADMGVSNGGLFWSDKAISDLEIGVPVSATLQEYLRTYAIVEPVYVAMTPTAVWAENAEFTTRDLGSSSGWLRRELALKRSIQILQRQAWRKADGAAQTDFVQGRGFKYPEAVRASGLVKSHTRFFVGQALSPAATLRLAVRGALIGFLGRPEQGLKEYFERSRSRAL